MKAYGDDGHEPQVSAPERSVPISTRAPAPRPRRLSRRAIALFAGGSALGLAATLGFALRSDSHRAAPPETVAVDRHQQSDLLATAPKDYGAVAQQKAAALSPPPTSTDQPGGSGVDAGSPFASATEPSGPANTDKAAAVQRQAQQRDSARSSKLFAGSDLSGRTAQVAQATPVAASAVESPQDTQVQAPRDAQDRKAAFVSDGARAATINSGRLAVPTGRYVVLAGSTIAAALITGLSSDLPGEVIAQVTEDVFDSTTGLTRLIPQGTRLIGSYDARVSYGQSRALVVWTRLILPDGRSLDLERLIGTDAAGQSGFADRVNRHTGKLLQAGLLSTLFGVGTRIATSSGNDDGIAFAIRDSASQSVERAGDKLVEHQLDVQPTITVRPGARVRVLVSRDLVLAPWQSPGQ